MCVFAPGIAVAGTGIGTFVFAPLTDYLIQQYTWRGTFLIIGSLMLNFTVCGALFRPLVSQPEEEGESTLEGQSLGVGMAEQLSCASLTLSLEEGVEMNPTMSAFDVLLCW